MHFPYRHISVIVMPTDSCNMNCAYCFNNRRGEANQKRMTEKTLGQLFKIVIPFYKEVRFIWHGGEPLLMGKFFYEKVFALQQESNITNANIKNSIQSNLTLMDKDFAQFFVNHHFSVGSSFDGTRNDLTRSNTQSIMNGHRILKEAGETNGFIYVVQSQNVDHLLEDYAWFNQNQLNYTINPYLTDKDIGQDYLYVSPQYYTKKLNELFDVWLNDLFCKISISSFEMMLDYVLHGRKHLCNYSSCLGKYIGIHYDGSIYACNRDFPEQYCFGNVWDYSDIRQCFESSGFQDLLAKAVLRRNHCKDNCDIYDFCEGGCNSCALLGGDIGYPNRRVCETIIPVLRHIQEQVRNRTGQNEQVILSNTNPRIAQIIIKTKRDGLKFSG